MRDGNSDRAWASATKMLRYINRTHGLDYTLESHLAGYLGGVYIIYDPAKVDKAILKWAPRKFWGPQVMRAAPLVVAAREAGWPTPAWLASGISPSGYPYQIQELARGTRADGVTLRLVQAVLVVIESHKGTHPDTEQDWFRFDHDVVYGAKPECFDTITAFSPEGAAFVELLRTWTAPFSDIPPLVADLVHGDMHPGNVMLDGDSQISALVDVEAIGKGTRFHDIGTLLSHGAFWGGEPEAINELLAHAERYAEPGALEISLASCLAGILMFLVKKNPESAKDAICTGTAFIDKLRQTWSIKREGSIADTNTHSLATPAEDSREDKNKDTSADRV